MKNSRRDFLKITGLAGIGLANASIFGCTHQPDKMAGNKDQFRQTYSQKFNMCGYAAPKIETIRIGFIGLGGRGTGAVNRIINIEGIEIKALADIRPERANSVYFQERYISRRHFAQERTGHLRR